MHIYNVKRVKGMISTGGIPIKSDIFIRFSMDVGTPGMKDGATLSISDDKTAMLLVSDDGIHAIKELISEVE